MKELILLKILNFFIENPYKQIYLRELAKKLKISPFAVKKYADFLIKEKLIKDEKKANVRYFSANISNLYFRYLKIAFNIRLITESGLIEFIRENISNVSSIVLFGSMAKGENDEKSDIDILIIGKRKYLDFSKIKTDREINEHVFTWSEWNEYSKKNMAFYQDIINYGIPLYGELPVIKWK